MESGREKKGEEKGSDFQIIIRKMGNQEGKEWADQTFCLEQCAHAYISLNIRWVWPKKEVFLTDCDSLPLIVH